MKKLTIQIRELVVGGTYSFECEAKTMKRLSSVFQELAENSDREMIVFMDEDEIIITKQ